MAPRVDASKPRRGLVALILVVLVAGCSSKPADPKAVDATQTNPFVTDETATSGLSGFVFDEEGVAVPGAELRLLPTNASAVSGEGGAYVFGPLPPGSFRLAASRLGYSDALADVRLVDGQPLVLNVTLVRLPSAEARTQLIGPYTGYFECRWTYTAGEGACGYVKQCTGAGCASTDTLTNAMWTHDKNLMKFQMEPGDWEEIVLEAKWTPTSVATTPKLALAFSYDGTTSGHLFGHSNASAGRTRLNLIDGRGAFGQILKPNEPKAPDANLTLTAWLYVPTSGGSLDPTDSRVVALTYDLRFEIWVSVFYGRIGPPGYSVLPPE